MMECVRFSNMETNYDGQQARESLAAAQDARQAAAGRFPTAWWYHIATGLVLGGAIVAFGLLPPAYWVGPVAVLLVLGELLRRTYQRRRGVWGYGTRAGSAALWNWGIVVVGIAAIAVEFLWQDGRPGWLPWVAGGITCAVAIVFGIAFDGALRRRIRRGTSR